MAPGPETRRIASEVVDSLGIPTVRAVVRTLVRIGENEALERLHLALRGWRDLDFDDTDLREALFEALEYRLSPEIDDDPESAVTEPFTLSERL